MRKLGQRTKELSKWWYSRPNNVTRGYTEAHSIVHEDDYYFSRSENFWDRVRVLGIISTPLILFGLAYYLIPSKGAEKPQRADSIETLEKKATESEFKDIILPEPK